jgi:hypothetical protein
VVDGLEPLAGDALPEIPEPRGDEEPADTPAARPEPTHERPRRRPRWEDAEPEPEAVAPAGAGPRRERGVDLADERDVLVSDPRSSRLGGALLLAGLGIALLVGLILLLSGGGDKKSSTNESSTLPPASAGTTTTPGQAPAGGATSAPVAQANLLPPGGGSSPAGLAQLLMSGQGANFLVAAQKLPKLANEYYAVWLYDSPSKAEPIGFFRSVDLKAGGRIAGATQVPQNYRSFKSMVLSREPVTKSKAAPKQPTQIVLQGTLKYTPAASTKTP